MLTPGASGVNTRFGFLRWLGASPRPTVGSEQLSPGFAHSVGGFHQLRGVNLAGLDPVPVAQSHIRLHGTVGGQP